MYIAYSRIAKEAYGIGCLDGDLVHIPSSLEKNENVDNSVNYLPINEVQSIVESPDEEYCSGNGLMDVIVSTSEAFVSVDSSIRSEFPASDYNFFVNAMAFQDARHIWIATDGGGLYLYDWQKHQVKNYTISQSLPSNTVYALVKTPIGKVWMSTDKGLAFIDNGKVTNLNSSRDWSGSTSVWLWSRTQDGRMIFGSNDGAVVLTSKFARN